MKTIGAAKFKAQCLAILDDVDPDGIVITKRGKPVARLMPIETDLSSLKGKYRDKMVVLGDIFSSDREWRAEP